MVEINRKTISVSRPVYMHFLDRELLSTFELYGVLNKAAIFDDLTILLLSTYEYLYFSTSLIFENRFARAAIKMYPLLFKRGHINLLMREYFFEDFIHEKRSQYEHSPNEYSFYFDNTWQKLSILNPAIIHKSFNTTEYLESAIITDINGQGLDETKQRIGIYYKPNEIIRLKPYIEESIYKRGAKAITKNLFSSVYENQKATPHEKRIFNIKISEYYVKSYLEELNGTIATGIRSAVDYFAYLCPTYPYHHLLLWRQIYQKIGCLPFLCQLKDRDIVTIRECAEFINFIQTIRLLIERCSEKQEEINHTTHSGKNLFQNILTYIPNAERTPSNHQNFISWLDISINRLNESLNANTYITKKSKEIQAMKDKVFVVHGRDSKKRKALFELLRSASLKPMEWEQLVSATGKGSPYIGEVLDKGFEITQAIVVLFTGDDLAKLNPDLLSSGENVEELTPQPRPNVILEAGMALGKNPDRTIIVQIGDMRNISDLLGRHVIYLKNDIPSRKTLLTRLETAGCAVDLTGSDWMSAGEF